MPVIPADIKSIIFPLLALTQTQTTQVFIDNSLAPQYISHKKQNPARLNLPPIPEFPIPELLPTPVDWFKVRV